MEEKQIWNRFSSLLYNQRANYKTFYEISCSKIEKQTNLLSKKIVLVSNKFKEVN